MPLGLERELQGKSKTSFVKWNVETLVWDENVHEILNYDNDNDGDSL